MARKEMRGEPVIRLNKVIRLFFEQTLGQLDANRMVQHIYPAEVYPGYNQINQERKKKGMWYSTGEGAKSFRGKMSKVATEKDTSFSMVYSYNDYMRYAELGVGKGLRAAGVERSKKAHYNVRYTRIWNKDKKRGHRPAIMPEFRHLQTRLMNYMTDYYCETITTNILVGIPDKINIGALI